MLLFNIKWFKLNTKGRSLTGSIQIPCLKLVEQLYSNRHGENLVKCGLLILPLGQLSSKKCY